MIELLRATIEAVADLPGHSSTLSGAISASAIGNMPVLDVDINRLVESYSPAIVPLRGVTAALAAGLHVTPTEALPPVAEAALTTATSEARLRWLVCLFRFRLAARKSRSQPSPELTAVTLPNLYGLAALLSVPQHQLRTEYVHTLYEIGDDSLAEEQLAQLEPSSRVTVALSLTQVAAARMQDLIQHLTYLASPAAAPMAVPRLLALARQVLACVTADMVHRLSQTAAASVCDFFLFFSKINHDIKIDWFLLFLFWSNSSLWFHDGFFCFFSGLKRLHHSWMPSVYWHV